MSCSAILHTTSLHNFCLWTASTLQLQGPRDSHSIQRLCAISLTTNRAKWRATLEQGSSDSASIPTGISNGQISSIGDDFVNASPMKQRTEHASITGGALDFKGSTEPLISRSLSLAKKVVLVRHGLSSWNEDSRIQGSSDLSVLSERGVLQAEKCRKALSNIKFDRCFASPISRAKSSAELIWYGREEPLLFLDSLREANLLFLEGMKNVDAQKQYPGIYKAWREDPVNFNVNGVYPVRELWDRAKKAWEDILSVPGEIFLVVTHKSILRALVCTALGMGPHRFRAIDINNGGISAFMINERGEPMLQSLNVTAHLHTDNVYY